MPTIADLKEKFEAAKAKGLAIVDTAATAGRPLTDDEQAKVMGYVTEAKGYDDQRRRLDGDTDVRKQLEALGFVAPEAVPGGDPRNLPLHVPGKSMGDQFIDSPDFKGWMKTVARSDGQIPDSVKGFSSPPVHMKSLLTGDSATSGGALVYSDQTNILVPAGRRPLTFREIITPGTTSSDTVEYARSVLETNNAAPVAEATDVSGGSGVKPQSHFTLERVTANVKTIAHWLAATKRALSDAGQLRTLIDNFLRFGLEEELEDQMVTGSGVGENFEGLDTVSGTQDQAWDTNILTTLRKAKTKVRTVGRATPTAYLLNSADWETIDLLQDNEARYFFGGPQRVAMPTLWGLPVVECEAVPQGWGWVGDFRLIVLWDREQASITVSDSHSDFFVRNLVAILAEMRAAFGILKPAAFVECDLTA